MRATIGVMLGLVQHFMSFSFHAAFPPNSTTRGVAILDIVVL
jgi:hypothetical protein